jgi:hypothetical protein
MAKIQIGHRLIEQQSLPRADRSTGVQLGKLTGKLHAPLLAARERVVAARGEMQNIPRQKALRDDLIAPMRD